MDDHYTTVCTYVLQDKVPPALTLALLLGGLPPGRNGGHDLGDVRGQGPHVDVGHMAEPPQGLGAVTGAVVGEAKVEKKAPDRVGQAAESAYFDVGPVREAAGNVSELRIVDGGGEQVGNICQRMSV